MPDERLDKKDLELIKADQPLDRLLIDDHSANDCGKASFVRRMKALPLRRAEGATQSSARDAPSPGRDAGTCFGWRERIE